MVVLATPSGLHPLQAMQAARAGCHVLTEKPMATKWDEGMEMVRVCRDAGVKLFVVKQNRLNATLQALKQAVEGEFRTSLEALPGVRVKVGLGASGEKYQLALSGEDGRVLAEHAQKVERELRGIPGVGNVTSSSSLVRPELVIRPDFAKAADLGVTSAAIADTLRVALLTR